MKITSALTNLTIALSLLTVIACKKDGDVQPTVGGTAPKVNAPAPGATLAPAPAGKGPSVAASGSAAGNSGPIVDGGGNVTSDNQLARMVHLIKLFVKSSKAKCQAQGEPVSGEEFLTEAGIHLPKVSEDSSEGWSWVSSEPSMQQQENFQKYGIYYLADLILPFAAVERIAKQQVIPLPTNPDGGYSPGFDDSSNDVTFGNMFSQPGKMSKEKKAAYDQKICEQLKSI